MNHPDFRAHGMIFATIGPDATWGMVRLPAEEQARVTEESPDDFEAFKAGERQAFEYGRYGNPTVAAADVAADLEAAFGGFQEAWDEVRVKFGVPRQQGGRRFGGGQANPADVFGQVRGLKGEILAFWEPPSDALITRYYAAKPALEAAMVEACSGL